MIEALLLAGLFGFVMGLLRHVEMLESSRADRRQKNESSTFALRDLD